MKNIKVLALVVTYNRINMLKECIDSLMCQTYKNFDILVVNNGSTDGTREYLDAQKNLIVIHQGNVGGAGGFYAGMKHFADNKEYDALWMMDDDGLTEEYQLKYLIDYSLKYKVDYSNALLLNRDDKTKMNDGITPYDKQKYDQMEIILNQISPFNGTLCYRNVIDKIGLIKKEMYIWGDELEYRLRVMTNGFKIATITKAIHYHPAFKGKSYILPFLKKGSITIKPGGKDWINYRNIGYIDATYSQHRGIVYATYFLMHFNFPVLTRFIKYYRMGKKNDYSLSPDTVL